MLTEQPSKMSFGLNLFEDSACISTPLSAFILMDLDNPLFLSPQATESLQLYLIRCLARSLSKRRNSNWLGSATYSICKKITYLGWISSKRIDNPSSTALLSNFTNYLSERMKSNGEISFLPIWARHDYYSHYYGKHTSAGKSSPWKDKNVMTIISIFHKFSFNSVLKISHE